MSYGVAWSLSHQGDVQTCTQLVCVLVSGVAALQAPCTEHYVPASLRVTSEGQQIVHVVNPKQLAEALEHNRAVVLPLEAAAVVAPQVLAHLHDTTVHAVAHLQGTMGHAAPQPLVTIAHASGSMSMLLLQVSRHALWTGGQQVLWLVNPGILYGLTEP